MFSTAVSKRSILRKTTTGRYSARALSQTKQPPLCKKNGRNLFAVGNRTHGKAVAFAEKYNIGKVYDSYDEMFTDPDVDIIYITTPHNTHYGFIRSIL